MSNKSKVELNWDETNEGEKGKLTDTVKKVVSSGIAAAFNGEDGLKQYLGDIKLPKDVLGQILKGASKSKDEVMRRIGDELIKLVSKVDIVNETTKFLETHRVKISAELNFEKKDKPEGDS